MTLNCAYSVCVSLPQRRRTRDLDMPAGRQTYWDQQPGRGAWKEWALNPLDSLAGSTGPTEAEERERRCEDAESSGGAPGQLLTARPVGPHCPSKKEPRGRLGSSLRKRRPRSGAGRQQRGARDPLDTGKRRHALLERLQEGLHAMRGHGLQGAQRGELHGQLLELLGARRGPRENKDAENSCRRTRTSTSGTTRAREKSESGTSRTRKAPRKKGPEGRQAETRCQDPEWGGLRGAKQERICRALRFQVSYVMLEWASASAGTAACSRSSLNVTLFSSQRKVRVGLRRAHHLLGLRGRFSLLSALPLTARLSREARPVS